MHCVDLGESFQTQIYLQNLASIQPRTSPPQFGRSKSLARRRNSRRFPGRDFYLDAEEALDYGLIDKILPTDEQVQELRRQKEGLDFEPIKPRKQLNL